MKIKYITYLLGILSIQFSANSQDFHLTQFDRTPTLLNPANIGSFTGKTRLNFVYRSQWGGLPSAFITQGAMLEVKGKKLNFGGTILKNDIGNYGIQQNHILGSVRYQKILTRHSSFRIGTSLGVFQKSFNPNNFTYDAQYHEGLGYITGSPNGEELQHFSTTNFDANFGAAFVKKSKFALLTIGLGANHLIKAKKGFYTSEIFTKPKTVGQINFERRISRHTWIVPSLMYAKQGTAQEIIWGINLKSRIHRDLHLSGGIANRMRDAFILKAGLDFRGFEIAYSYDINTSTFNNIASGQGASELHVAIIFGRNRERKRPKIEEMGLENGKIKSLFIDRPLIENTSLITKPLIRSKKFDQKIIMANNLDDLDGDRIPDYLDKCPRVFGSFNTWGCPDKDKDGVPDPSDACPDQWGSIYNAGCPEQKQSPTQIVQQVIPTPAPLNKTTQHTKQQPIQQNYSQQNHIPQYNRQQPVQYNQQQPITPIQQQTYLPIQQQLQYPTTNTGGGHQSSQYPIYPSSQSRGTYQSSGQVRSEMDLVVYFDKNQAYIKQRYETKLIELARHLMHNQDFRLILSGHTDSDGSSYYNIELGSRRSQSVYSYLIRYGIDPARVIWTSYGEESPSASNQSINGQAINRRVEIKIVYYSR